MKTNKRLPNYNNFFTNDYPLKNIEYENIPTTQKQFIKKILYLFVYYASKGQKHSYYQLQEYHFMELMSDLIKIMEKQLNSSSKSSNDLIDHYHQLQKKKIRKKSIYNNLTNNQKYKDLWNNLQLIYHTKRFGNLLTFQNFLQLLPYLARYFCSQLNRPDSFQNFMIIIINIYQQKVLPQLKGKVIQLNLQIQLNTRQFIKKLLISFIKLYKRYFTNQLLTINNQKQKKLSSKNIESYKQHSLESFFELLKDLQIYPKLISARNIFYIFLQRCQANSSYILSQIKNSQIIDNQLGQIFTLTKLIQSLLIISNLVYPKLKASTSPGQKSAFKTLLEYIQLTILSNTKKNKLIEQQLCFILQEQSPMEIKIKKIQVDNRVIKEPAGEMQFFKLMGELSCEGF